MNPSVPLSAPSSDLLAANQQLLALRKQVVGQQRQPRPSQTSAISEVSAAESLPAHLGWESKAVTAVLRRQGNNEGKGDWLRQLARTAVPEQKEQTKPDKDEQQSTWVKLYPDIGLGMLRQEATAAGRLWLLLRGLDREGCGKIRIVNLLSTLTDKQSPLYLCGKRQLKNLLRAGEDIYWGRDKRWLWLRSAAKVAYSLGVEQVKGQPVALPLRVLLNGIGEFRAHLYAAFHSSRTRENQHGVSVAPIARETMVSLSGVGRSSQRNYEQIVGLQVQANFAVGLPATAENKERMAWKKGTAVYEMKDYRGQQGKKGKYYLAWQIPNSYIGAHQHRPKGRQKRINRELKDLVMKGMPGNVVETDETLGPDLRKRYFPNGKLAAKAYGRDPQRELYWRQNKTTNRQFVVWQQLGGD